MHCLIVHRSIDCTLYAWLFTNRLIVHINVDFLWDCMNIWCKDVCLRLYEIECRNAFMYVCTTSVCYVYEFIDSNVTTRLCIRVQRMYIHVYEIANPNVSMRECMYVCMYVRKYDYDFSRIKCHNAFYYEIHEFVYGKWCMFNVFDVTVKIAIATICMASTHWDLAHYYVFNEVR